MHRRTLLSACALLALAGTPLAGQDPHAHHGRPPEQLGRVEFPVSCSAEAAERITRAVALLHSFWFAEADQAFKAVETADPGCAMAHWGRAMVQMGNPFAVPGAEALQAGLAAVERAEALGAPTPRERGYIAAAAAFFRDHERVDHRTRALAHEAAMQRLHALAPDDVEVAIFYARALIPNAAPGDKTFERQLRAAGLLEPLFERFPDHPGLAHYLIHAFDAPPLAYRGRFAADRYNQIAPSVPHARHMPSHIYTRLGLWDASIRANQSSAAAAEEYERATGQTRASMDRVHAWDYLVYAHLQQGQAESAARVAEEAQRVRGVQHLAVDYAMAAIPARLLLERSDWRAAAALPTMQSQYGAASAVRHFARGIGAARSGQLDVARREVEALAALRDGLAARGDAYWSQAAEAQRLAVSAWLAHHDGNGVEALRLAQEAAELEERIDKHPVTPGPILPSRELLGDLLLERERPREALAAYEATLQHEPNRARSLHGAALAAERAGDATVAREHYQAYLQLMAQAEGERPELERARAFLQQRR